VDTLAKVITPATTWRCRSCEKTWTLASPPGLRWGPSSRHRRWRLAR